MSGCRSHPLYISGTKIQHTPWHLTYPGIYCRFDFYAEIQINFGTVEVVDSIPQQWWRERPLKIGSWGTPQLGRGRYQTYFTCVWYDQTVEKVHEDHHDEEEEKKKPTLPVSDTARPLRRFMRTTTMMKRKRGNLLYLCLILPDRWEGSWGPPRWGRGRWGRRGRRGAPNGFPDLSPQPRYQT